MEKNTIYLRDVRELDPILRKGDPVRLCYDHEITVEDFGFGSGICDVNLNGLIGLVTSVGERDKFGQAIFVTVALPFEEGWELFSEISIKNIHRLVSPESVRRQWRKNPIHKI